MIIKLPVIMPCLVIGVASWVMTQTEIHDNKMSTLSKCIIMINNFKILNHILNNLVYNYM